MQAAGSCLTAKFMQRCESVSAADAHPVAMFEAHCWLCQGWITPHELSEEVMQPSRPAPVPCCLLEHLWGAGDVVLQPSLQHLMHMDVAKFWV